MIEQRAGLFPRGCWQKKAEMLQALVECSGTRADTATQGVYSEAILNPRPCLVLCLQKGESILNH